MICETCEAPITKGDHCENCQEEAYMRHQQRLMEDGPGPSLIEQQREAWKLK